MLITNGTIVQSGMRRRTIQRQVSLGPVSLRIVTIVILATAGLFALMQSTASATKAYQETDLQRQLKAGQEQVEVMNGDAARLRALQNNSMVSDPTATPSPTLKLDAPTKIDSLPGGPAISQLP